MSIQEYSIDAKSGLTYYSLYDAGDFYKKHLDQFKDNSNRQFSMISYLNPHWEAKDGGELFIHQANNNQTITSATFVVSH